MLDENEVGESEGGEVALAPSPKKRGRAAPKAKATNVIEMIKIPSLELREGVIPIIGTSPLIVNNFSDKSKKEMLDRQIHALKGKRPPKVPTEDFLGSLYVINGKPKLQEKGGKTLAVDFVPGFPANAIKNAAVSACAQIEGIFKTTARAAFHVLGYRLTIIDPKTKKPAIPWMRDDIVRLAGPRPVADIRFRACFDAWRIDVPVQFNAKLINLSAIAHLLHHAGFGVGIGEWRPECDGNHGMFSVEV